MTDQVEELERPAENTSSGDEYVDLTPEYAREILDALGDDDVSRAEELISELHFADIADLLGWASSWSI